MKKTKSYKGLWGQTVHYDNNGNKIGSTWKNGTGGKNHYDANMNVVGKSYKNFWGGTTHYDANMNPVGKSYRNFYGGITHYDNDMNEVGKSHRNFAGGQTTEYHRSCTGKPNRNLSSDDQLNHDLINAVSTVIALAVSIPILLFILLCFLELFGY